MKKDRIQEAYEAILEETYKGDQLGGNMSVGASKSLIIIRAGANELFLNKKQAEALLRSLPKYIKEI